jgi:hypothetical protein
MALHLLEQNKMGLWSRISHEEEHPIYWEYQGSQKKKLI